MCASALSYLKTKLHSSILHLNSRSLIWLMMIRLNLPAAYGFAQDGHDYDYFVHSSMHSEQWSFSQTEHYLGLSTTRVHTSHSKSLGKGCRTQKLPERVTFLLATFNIMAIIAS